MDRQVGRSEYRKGELDRSDLADDPVTQLESWLSDAVNANVTEPYAMCVSSVSQDGRPSSRMVLLRGLDERGLVFYTNLNSRKAAQIELNPFVCANFWWGDLERQVRIEGSATRVQMDEARAYFASRPRSSQISAHASPQSQVIASREVLDQAMNRFETMFPNDVPMPENWGGIRIVPDQFEFWQGRPSRIHDRFRYSNSGETWAIQRLAP